MRLKTHGARLAQHKKPLNALMLQKVTMSVVLLASAPRIAKPSFPPNLTACQYNCQC
jgi:hypothetical protein